MNDITESVLHSTVENLNLAWNILGNQGATSLSQIIQRSSTLKSLNLSRNEIGDSGLQDIAQALAKNTTLKSLNLEGNQITSAGVKLLADALRYNTTLEFLDLRRNDISDSSTPEWIELDRTFACFGPDLKRREPQLDTNLPLSARIAQSLDRFFRTYSFFSSMKASE
jgi:Leucine-rich repeat (LRR) protein